MKRNPDTAVSGIPPIVAVKRSGTGELPRKKCLIYRYTNGFLYEAGDVSAFYQAAMLPEEIHRLHHIYAEPLDNATPPEWIRMWSLPIGGTFIGYAFPYNSRISRIYDFNDRLSAVFQAMDEMERRTQ